VSLTYNRRVRDFSSQERSVLNLLRPHLFEAYRNAELITRLREHTSHAAFALDSRRQGAITLDANGRGPAGRGSADIE
jgi:GAF domain-containing protein